MPNGPVTIALVALLTVLRAGFDRFIFRQTLGPSLHVNSRKKKRGGGVGVKMAHPVDRSRSIIGALILGKRITAMDVAWLRREIFIDGYVTREQAEELFDVERSGVARDEAWTALFVDLITDHVVWQSRPTGVVNEPQAEWLLAQSDSCKTAAALAALGNILAEAQRSPAWLAGAVRKRMGDNWRGVDRALAAAG